MSLLQVTDIVRSYVTKRNLFGRPVAHNLAVDRVTFDIEPGETVALVGESGSGKSTTGRLVAALDRPDGGDIVFDGSSILALDRRQLKRYRESVQVIFQDPFGSLDPRIPIVESVGEPLLLHRSLDRKQRRAEVSALLDRVGLGADFLDRRPFELSGGQLQRVSIARALTLRPSLIVCDEPVSALDVSVQAQVLNLMLDLQEEFQLSYLFISHDLGVVRSIADRIVVMRQGVIVEQGDADSIFESPEDPYTKELLAASLDLDEELVEADPLLGE